MIHPASTAVPTTEGSGGGGGSRTRALVAALAVTQTVGYGALYYSYAVFLTPLAHDLHASTTTVTGALTAATLVGAAAAVPVGAWLDRHGGRALMTTGSIAGTALLAALSTVDSLVGLYAVWVGIGFASAMVLYEPAFAVIITWHPNPRARANALLAVTVAAGFASSIFLPLTGALVHAYGWRTAALVLATTHGLLTIPLHASLVRRPPATTRARTHQTGRTGIRTALRDRYFWLLAVAFVANTAAIATITVHLVAYLVEAGHPATFAADVAGLLGILSVTGRLVTTGLNRRIPLGLVVAAIFTIQALAAAVLPVVGHTTIGAVTTVVAFGLGFGASTIARPALLAGRYDTSAYATIAGLLTVPVTIAKAGAPLAAAAVHTAAGSYTPVLIAVAAACAIAATAIAISPRRCA